MTRLIFLAFASAGLASAQIYGEPQVQVYAPSPLLREVGINQKMDAQVPLDVPFADETGSRVTLRSYSGKPMILALVYYQCPSLCTLVLNGLARTVRQLDLKGGKDYELVAISFDPRETSEMAAAKLQTYRKADAKGGANATAKNDALAGWHFLTGPETSSKAVAEAMGFRYVYDALTNQYAHSSAIVILTPAGKIARYFYGIDYPVRDVRLSLVEASHEKIGSATDQVLLYCFHYDPSTGKYAVVVMNVLRIAGGITAVLLGGFLWIMFRRERHVSRLNARSAV